MCLTDIVRFRRVNVLIFMGESLKDIPQLSLLENFCLSGTAAAISKTVAAPIERLKLNIQNQNEMIKQGRLDLRYTGICDCAKRIAKSEGYLAFWRGNGANVLRYFPTQALNFAFLGEIKKFFAPNVGDSNGTILFKNVTAGGVAGSMSLGFVYSLDYARTRLANDSKMGSKGGSRQFKGIIDVYRKTLSTDGFVGLYRGFNVSCLGVFVYRGLYFGLYDSAKPILGSEKLPLVVSISLAYVITVLSGLISYPLDTIRRRMMMTSGSGMNYRNSFDCAMQIVKNEGPMSLFKGVGANILRGIAGALVIAGFDEMRHIYIKNVKEPQIRKNSHTDD